MHKKFLKIPVLISILTASHYIQANDNIDKGYKIALERESINNGWQSSTSEMEMILINRKGGSSKRTLTSSNLESKHGDKSLITFKFPYDIAGTSLLSHAHTLKADDKWLYLPALKRVKRISSKNQSGSFMGSEFSYEDLSGFAVEDFTYNYIRQDTINNKEVHVIEQYPKDKHSGYTKQINFIEKDRLIPIKIEYYDRKNSFSKTLTFSNYEKYNGKFWRANEMHVINHLTKKQTKIITKNLIIGAGLTDKNFQKSKLKRGRK